MEAIAPNPLERKYQGEHPVRTLWYLLTNQRGKIVLAGFIFLIKHSPVWILPLLTANIIDVLVSRLPIRNLWINAGAFAALLLQNIPLHYVYARFLSQVIRSLEMQLRSVLTQRFQHLSMDYYKHVSAGILQSKMVRDVETIEQMMRQLFDSGLAAVSNLIGAILITAIRTPEFLLFFLAIIPISSFLRIKLLKVLIERNMNFRQQIERMAARTSDMTHLIPITRAHGLEKNEIARMEHTLSKLKLAGFELDISNAIFGSLVWVTFNLFSGVCLVVAAWLSYSGLALITAGDVVMVTSYFTSISAAILALISLTPLIVRGFESIRSLGEVLESPDIEQNTGKKIVSSVQGQFEFLDVCYSYPDGDHAAVEDINLTVNPGETIALVGPSGAGKSTLINLVVGFIRPTTGQILLDGEDMETLDLRTYRRFLSIVPQETILFDGTIRENVTHGLRKVRDEDIHTALQEANALEFVRQLPEGLDSIVGEHGSKLSGGQKQRLAITRALIRDPRVLILDEATSALDTDTEALIQEALENLMVGRTTFIAAHRLSTIKNADRIIVLDEGKIVEIGSHKTLMAKNGLYAKLYQGQVV